MFEESLTRMNAQVEEDEMSKKEEYESQHRSKPVSPSQSEIKHLKDTIIELQSCVCYICVFIYILKIDHLKQERVSFQIKERDKLIQENALNCDKLTSQISFMGEKISASLVSQLREEIFRKNNEMLIEINAKIESTKTSTSISNSSLINDISQIVDSRLGESFANSLDISHVNLVAKVENAFAIALSDLDSKYNSFLSHLVSKIDSSLQRVDSAASKSSEDMSSLLPLIKSELSPLYDNISKLFRNAVESRSSELKQVGSGITQSIESRTDKILKLIESSRTQWSTSFENARTNLLLKMQKSEESQCTIMTEVSKSLLSLNSNVLNSPEPSTLMGNKHEFDAAMKTWFCTLENSIYSKVESTFREIEEKNSKKLSKIQVVIFLCY